MDVIQEEISNLQQQISAYEGLIGQKANELAETEAKEKEQYDLFCQRVRVMEEEGDLKAAQQENSEENSEENTEENTEEAFWRLWLAGEADLVYDPAAKEVVHASELTEVRESVGCDEIGGKSGVLSPCVLVPAEADYEADEACAEEREEAEPCAGRVSGKTEESRVTVE